MFARIAKNTIPEGEAQENAPVGLLAGWGEFPFSVARALRSQGRRIAGVGILDHADPALADLCDEFGWIGIGGIGRAIRHFRRWGVTRATMAGKVHKVLLYQPHWWLKHGPDLTAILAFYPQLFAANGDRRDDTLLRRVVQAFASRGIEFQPATDFAPELLVAPGQLAGQRLSHRQEKDVRFGWQMARAMGGLDVGQCVCVKNQTVLAIEAIEGTDLCIRRAGELCKSGGFTVVKVAKPNQDMRFDVPTVGVKTLETIAGAGGSVLAIEAGKTIVLNQGEFTRATKRLGLSVVAHEEATESLAAA